MSENKRILLAVATSKMVLSFRRDMIKKFQSEGYSVAVAALDGAYGEVIEKELGVKFYCMEDNNRSLSPLKILSLKNKEDCYRFFEDLCTKPELNAMAQRIVVAKLLTDKTVYSEIVKRTGASTATISRVNRSLNEDTDGYRLAFERLVENGYDL